MQAFLCRVVVEIKKTSNTTVEYIRVGFTKAEQTSCNLKLKFQKYVRYTCIRNNDPQSA